jgi:chorismate mutase-like protein
MNVSKDLPALRRDIDEIDAAIVDLLARRMQVCREVAAIKAGSATPVIQPARVREVLTSRRQWAIDHGVDADFAEQIFRIVLSETHRIEVAHELGEEAPAKAAGEIGGALDTVAVRIDHVVVCVANLDSATAFLDSLGFTVSATDDADIKTADAGGITVVLVGPGSDPAVQRHLAQHGSGVQHIAIEVLNARFVQEALAAAGVPLLTDVLIDAAGHEQLFTVADPATGVQLGFVSRTGHRVPVTGHHVRSLFALLGTL